jgi:serine/threonine protein kinase, bacterial
MDELSDGTRRLNQGRRLLTNPRLARAALRSGFQSLPSATVAHLLRHVPPVGSAPSPPPPPGPPLNEGKREGGKHIENGSSFAGYTILRPLGAGGMAEVYLALHPRLPRRDVIKVLAEAITADSEFRERFNREADLAATLWHPHIVGVHDRGEFDGKLWISMDYVAGTDASRLVKERYPDGMPVQEVSAILTAVAGALDYAHDRGLLHRDVKPANILLSHADDEERRILLADFGVARHLASVSGITETNVAVGTVAYAAPEQLTGGNIDGRADQYALAASAFHLLTGAPPFLHPNPVAVISQHLHEEPPALSEFRPELAYLDDVFRKALAKDPDDRFDRCRGFSAAIREHISAVTDSDDDAQYFSAGPPWRRTPRGLVSAAAHKFSPRTRWMALVCAVLIAVAATWSILYTFQTDGSQPKPALTASAPAAATPARVLNGTYRLDYDRSKRTTNGTPLRHTGAASSFWAFRSACTSNGCAATGVELDDATHQVAGTTDGGQSDVLHFAAGYWQGTPAQERVGCTQQNGPVRATQAETVAWSLAPQPDGTLRGVETETVTSNECGAQGAVVRVPVVATRTGNAPPKLALPDPAQSISAPATPSAKPSPPVLGGICSDADKLGYDQTSNEQVVCEGNAWSKAPITTGGVHAAGSSCDQPDVPVFAMATSNDGYLLQCDAVTRTWTRH